MNPAYLDTARLLTQVAPLVFVDDTFAHLEQLPGIRWKLHNLVQLKKINAKKFAEQADALTTRLNNTGQTKN